MLKRKRSSDISLPKARTVHGIKVEKVPVGKFIASMQDIQDLPKTIIERCFPEQGSLGDLIGTARVAGGEEVVWLLGNLLREAPQLIIELAAHYMDTEEDALLALTPTELLDVLEAWWELNDLTDFLKRVWRKAKPMIDRYQARPTPGSKSGSPSPPA